MQYLQNRWYAAGWSEDIGREPILRVMLDEPIVLYRTEAGQAVAMSDKCPHRFAPLHAGKLFGDAIRCPYHGLRFGPDGNCVDNPIGAGVVPTNARTRLFETRERNGIVWLWIGDDASDETKIVSFDFLDDPQYDLIGGYISVAANYALLADNLLDLSHAEFIHPNLSSPGANQRVRMTVECEGETVRALNARPNEPPTALLRLGLGDRANDAIEMWSNVEWNPPAVLSVEVGGTPIGHRKDEGVNTIAAHLITPESATRSHYFWRLGRNFRTGDAAFSTQLQAMVAQAFADEDVPIIEAQQRYLGDVDLSDRTPVYLQGDKGGVIARRILAELIARSKAGEATAPGDG